MTKQTKTEKHTPRSECERQCVPACRAARRGLVVGQDDRGGWVAYFVHDSEGDGHWNGAYYQAVAEGRTEAEVRAAIRKAEGEGGS